MSNLESQLLTGILALAALILFVTAVVGTVLAIEAVKDHRIQRKYFEQRLRKTPKQDS